jgi:aspartyl-tRNA(Asn)/glutamyl-tRNA(Gln) amidotransferase subunit C
MPASMREEVERAAALARLSLDDAELTRLARELDAILAYVAALERVDTRDVLPTSHVVPLPTPLRSDEPEPPLPVELALANAPECFGSAFVVPKVIDSEETG